MADLSSVVQAIKGQQARREVLLGTRAKLAEEIEELKQGANLEQLEADLDNVYGLLLGEEGAGQDGALAEPDETIEDCVEDGETEPSDELTSDQNDVEQEPVDDAGDVDEVNDGDEEGVEYDEEPGDFFADALSPADDQDGDAWAAWSADEAIDETAEGDVSVSSNSNGLESAPGELPADDWDDDFTAEDATEQTEDVVDKWGEDFAEDGTQDPAGDVTGDWAYVTGAGDEEDWEAEFGSFTADDAGEEGEKVEVSDAEQKDSWVNLFLGK